MPILMPIHTDTNANTTDANANTTDANANTTDANANTTTTTPASLKLATMA